MDETKKEFLDALTFKNINKIRAKAKDPVVYYARGYCTICGDRRDGNRLDNQVCLNKKAKRLVCASCFAEAGEPNTCTMCRSQMYAGDWYSVEHTEEAYEEMELAGKSDDEIEAEMDRVAGLERLFFCERCEKPSKDETRSKILSEYLKTGKSPKVSRAEIFEGMMKDAVMDEYLCHGCGAPLEADAKKCGLCNTKNVLSSFI